MSDTMPCTTWPFQEAYRLIRRAEQMNLDVVTFETGYGPSGLPHIGTFAEVARTTMVCRSFQEMSDIPTRLIAFSDDMDGMRKVPDNVPNPDQLKQHLGLPLSRVPDPFGTHESFAAHNNAQLRDFLDRFGFNYEFKSATECYRSGEFDEALIRVLECYDRVMEIILPTLGEARQETYSPFLPICPETGRVLQIPAREIILERATIVFDNGGTPLELPITGGNCKLQWKADWAMRWYALGVDYEMSGKDLIESVRLSSQIIQALGQTKPEQMTYELFLDEEGHKISKSVGNGLTIDQWLRYAPAESLSLYLFQSPRKAKKLCWDVIPRAVEDYIKNLNSFWDQDPAEQLKNPVWYAHAGDVPSETIPVSFGMMLNLVSASSTDEPCVLWRFIERQHGNLCDEVNPVLDQLLEHAINYYQDYVEPFKEYRVPNERELRSLRSLLTVLQDSSDLDTEEVIQSRVYEVGKTYSDDLRGWFQMIYQVVFGQNSGPRLGTFFHLYGIDNSIALISERINSNLTGTGT